MRPICAMCGRPTMPFVMIGSEAETSWDVPSFERWKVSLVTSSWLSASKMKV